MTSTHRTIDTTLPNVGTVSFFRERHSIESSLTLAVLEALPADQLSFRAHPRSQSAGMIVATMVRCLQVCDDLIRTGRAEMPSGESTTAGPLVEQFRPLSRSIADQLAKLNQGGWEHDVVVTKNDVFLLHRPLGELLWLFLFDAIHHRGQLTTYLRPMGAKVPSIYGTSGDDRTTT